MPAMRRSLMLLSVAVVSTAALPRTTSAEEADSLTVHVGDNETVRRVVLERTPMLGQEPGAAGGAVTLAIVVYQGGRMIGRFAVEGNQGILEADRSPSMGPVVFAITRSCGGSCSNLYVTAVEVPQRGSPKEIFRQQFFGGKVTVSSDGFTVSEPEYAMGEPNCCPSREKVSTFRRRGAGYTLVQSRVQPKGT